MSKGADWLVGGCSRLARRLHMSDFVVSALIIGIGANIPELLITFMVSGSGMESIVIPNITASNIINIFGVVGICAVFHPLKVPSVNKRAIKMLLGSTAIFAVMLYDGNLNLMEGIALLAMFIIYAWGNRPHSATRHDLGHTGNLWKDLLLLAGGVFSLYFGSELFMDGLEKMIDLFGLTGDKLGALIVAPGTTGPEIIVTILAIARKKTNMIIGTMVGSCIAHIVLIGAAAGIVVHPAATSIEVMLTLLATLMFSIDLTIKKEVSRFAGFIYVGLLAFWAYTTAIA